MNGAVSDKKGLSYSIDHGINELSSDGAVSEKMLFLSDIGKGIVLDKFLPEAPVMGDGIEFESGAVPYIACIQGKLCTGLGATSTGESHGLNNEDGFTETGRDTSSSIRCFFLGGRLPMSLDNKSLRPVI